MKLVKRNNWGSFMYRDEWGDWRNIAPDEHNKFLMVRLWLFYLRSICFVKKHKSLYDPVDKNYWCTRCFR